MEVLENLYVMDSGFQEGRVERCGEEEHWKAKDYRWGVDDCQGWSTDLLPVAMKASFITVNFQHDLVVKCLSG